MHEKKISEKTILLLENDAGSARLIESLLQNTKNLEVEISWVSRLGDGMRLAEKRAYDLVLFDVNLKGSAPLQALSEFHLKNPMLPIVVLADTFDEQEYCQYYSLGVRDLLIKNKLSSADLIKAICFVSHKRISISNDDTISDILDHHYRTYLTNIKGAVDLVCNQTVGTLNHEQQKLCSLAVNNIHKFKILIDDVHIFTKLDNNTYSFTMKKEDISFTIKEAVAIVKKEAEDKDLIVYMKEAPDLPMCIYDHETVLRLFLGLLTNAIAFTQQGRIEILSTVKDNMIHISFHDTGIGIHEKDQEKMFDPFYLVPLADKFKNKQGTGLGLAIAKRIAQLHGGNLTVESRFGEGSTFQFTIPVQL